MLPELITLSPPPSQISGEQQGRLLCAFADDLSTAVRTQCSLKRTILILPKALSVRTSVRSKQMNRQSLHANEQEAIFPPFLSAHYALDFGEGEN